MARIYLAARYGRQKEMGENAKLLRAAGHEVVSSWVDGHHEQDYDRKAKAPIPTNLMQKWASEDIRDLKKADTLILFTDKFQPVSGGREVEFGWALGQGLEVYVIGPCNNVFHCLFVTLHPKTMEDCLELLNSTESTPQYPS